MPWGVMAPGPAGEAGGQAEILLLEQDVSVRGGGGVHMRWVFDAPPGWPPVRAKKKPLRWQHRRGKFEKNQYPRGVQCSETTETTATEMSPWIESGEAVPGRFMFCRRKENAVRPGVKAGLVDLLPPSRCARRQVVVQFETVGAALCRDSSPGRLNHRRIKPLLQPTMGNCSTTRSTPDYIAAFAGEICSVRCSHATTSSLKWGASGGQGSMPCGPSLIVIRSQLTPAARSLACRSTDS